MDNLPEIEWKPLTNWGFDKDGNKYVRFRSFGKEVIRKVKS